jgi:pilus assembly protein Flp/PilA
MAHQMLTLSPAAHPRADHLTREGLKMKNLLKRLWQEQEGQDLTEYALLVVLIALVAIASMQTLGHAISDAFASASTNLTTT